MKITSPILSIVTAVFATVALSMFYFSLLTPKTALGAANEVPATVATTSSYSLTTTAQLIFATSTCGSRIISTQASPIMLTFSDNQGAVPSALNGVLQPASTTVAYSNGTYGCGAYRAYSFTTATSSVMESR